MPALDLSLLIATTHDPYLLSGILTVAAALIVIVVMMATSQSDEESSDT